MASIRRKDTRWCMMPYACGDMMHLLRKYDVAPVGRNDAMFAPMCRQAHIIREANIIGEANIICRRQTSFKKRTFVGRQKCVFCWQGQEDSNPRPTVLETGTLPAELYPCMTNVPIISHFILFCNTFFKKIVYYRISFTSISN